MIFLGIDSASISCSAAVYNSETGEITEEFVNNGLTHSQTLMPMIESVLTKSEIKAKDIDLIAITKGPGSFTGLRIGMATAKGISAPFDIPCVTVSTLEAIAETAGKNFNGILCAVMDARCNQVYNAIFEAENGELKRLCDDRAISITDLEKDLENYDKPILLCGDGTAVCEKNFYKTGFSLADEENRLPKATAVCLLGEKYKSKSLSSDKITPVYLRLPQAVRTLLNKK